MKFAGLNASVSLDVDSKFDDALSVVFANWRYEFVTASPYEPLAAVTFDGSDYTLSSVYMEKPEAFADPLNTLCRLIVELAWAQLREHPKMLCLHGAAIEIAGRLVVFPSTRRAGKSTLCQGFQTVGTPVFTDDFLPLLINANGFLCGMSQGISTRVRLPLPDHTGAEAQAFMRQQPHIKNRQYQYTAPTKETAASFGSTAPIGALVFLEQRDGAEPLLEEIDKSEALTALIRQNFSRAANAAAILDVLSQSVKSTPCYRLSFDKVETAVAKMNAMFSSWPTPLTAINAPDFSPAPDAIPAVKLENWQIAQLVRNTSVTETNIEKKRYLSGQNNRSIVYLNEGAAIIWHLLEEPISGPEIIDLLGEAFPDQPLEAIQKDVTTTLQSFIEHQLVKLAPSAQVSHGT